MEFNNILKCFPNTLREEIQGNINFDEKIKKYVEEIRIRMNLPVILKIGTEDVMVQYIIKREDMSYILQRICENSLYSYQNQIANGYITINGGHRVRTCRFCGY